MDVSPHIRKGTFIIQSYKNGIFRVSGASYTHAIMITADTLAPWDGTFDALPAHDVLIYGTGAVQVWPPAPLRVKFPMEVMSTPAACRTYNALISEGRHVLALLQPHIEPAAN